MQHAVALNLYASGPDHARSCNGSTRLKPDKTCHAGSSQRPHQVRTRDIRFVQALLEQGAIANSKEPVTLTTPLHAAFQSNLVQVRCFAACAQRVSSNRLFAFLSELPRLSSQEIQLTQNVSHQCLHSAQQRVVALQPGRVRSSSALRKNAPPSFCPSHGTSPIIVSRSSFPSAPPRAAR